MDNNDRVSLSFGCGARFVSILLRDIDRKVYPQLPGRKYGVITLYMKNGMPWNIDNTAGNRIVLCISNV